MRAERDDEDVGYRAARKPKERRLAYEIALGIFLGGCALMVTAQIAMILEAQVAMHQLQIQFGR